MYSYNLDVGEHYYSPMTTYLDRNASVERTSRAETPGAMTFSERLQHRWINGRRYESSARSASVARESGVAVSASGTEASAFAPRAARAASEIPAGRVAVATAQSAAQAAGAMSSASMAAQSEQRQQQSASAYASKAMMKQEAMSSSTLQASAKSASMSSSREETTETITRSSASSATAKKVQMMQAEQRARMLEVSQRASSQQRSSRREEAQVQSLRAADIKVNSSEDTWRFLQNPVNDCIEKKIADIRMQPYVGNQEIRDAEAASLRARARILDLERELDDITKRAIMTSTKAVKSAKQMAYEASMEAAEEAKASSTKKSRKVIVESKSSIKA